MSKENETKENGGLTLIVPVKLIKEIRDSLGCDNCGRLNNFELEALSKIDKLLKGEKYV